MQIWYVRVVYVYSALCAKGEVFFEHYNYYKHGLQWKVLQK